MEYTRRAYGIAALAGGLALLAVILDTAVLFGGTAGIVGWLLGRQWLFVRTATGINDGLDVEQKAARESLTVDESTIVTVETINQKQSEQVITVESQPPVTMSGSTAEDRVLRLEPGTERKVTSFTLTAPTAGRHQFAVPAVRIEDSAGLFRTAFETGTRPTLTVEPRRPDDVHVGEGGEQLGAFGSFSADQFGDGIEPAELRAYVPGDPADRIDWNATARLGEPHVLEFEVDTDRQTILILDHRPSLTDGPDGTRKLDYLRQVALALVGVARKKDQSIGLLTVGADGITTRLQPATGRNHYTGITEALFDVAEIEGEMKQSANTHGGYEALRSPSEARRAMAVLEDGKSDFGRTLQPFFSDFDPYIRRIAEQPLYESVRSEVAQTQGQTVTIVLTDDTGKKELTEAVSVGSRGGNRAAAFVTPSVLFAEGGLSDLSAAYDQYLEFETFRRELASQPRVEAYEVGPESRIESLLAGRRGGELQ